LRCCFFWRNEERFLFQVFRPQKRDSQQRYVSPFSCSAHPQYANYDLYLGLVALHFEENTEQESINQGIAVIKRVGESMVINDERLKVF